MDFKDRKFLGIQLYHDSFNPNDTDDMSWHEIICFILIVPLFIFFYSGLDNDSTIFKLLVSTFMTLIAVGLFQYVLLLIMMALFSGIGNRLFKKKLSTIYYHVFEDGDPGWVNIPIVFVFVFGILLILLAVVFGALTPEWDVSEILWGIFGVVNIILLIILLYYCWLSKPHRIILMLTWLVMTMYLCYLLWVDPIDTNEPLQQTILNIAVCFSVLGIPPILIIHRTIKKMKP